MSGLESRRPPEKPPNWCTSYRLKCAGLVGVVQLGASHETLRPECSLQWGEIVAVSLHPGYGADQDFKERARGRMAIRLLNSGDLSSLQQSPDLLVVGARVAVIDLRVFVPEVISVRRFRAVVRAVVPRATFMKSQACRYYRHALIQDCVGTSSKYPSSAA